MGVKALAWGPRVEISSRGGQLMSSPCATPLTLTQQVSGRTVKTLREINTEHRTTVENVSLI